MTCTILSNETEKNWQCRNEHEQPYVALKLFLMQKIRQLYADGYTDFYLNCEEGVPLWAGEIVCCLKEQECTGMRLHVAIPYEEQCRDWTEELRDRYYRVHEQADSVTQTGTHPDADCYLRAEKFMVQDSDLLLLFGNAEDDSRFAEYAGTYDVRLEFVDDRQFDVF